MVKLLAITFLLILNSCSSPKSAQQVQADLESYLGKKVEYSYTSLLPPESNFSVVYFNYLMTMDENLPLDLNLVTGNSELNVEISMHFRTLTSVNDLWLPAPQMTQGSKTSIYLRVYNGQSNELYDLTNISTLFQKLNGNLNIQPSGFSSIYLNSIPADIEIEYRVFMNLKYLPYFLETAFVEGASIRTMVIENLSGKSLLLSPKLSEFQFSKNKGKSLAETFSQPKSIEFKENGVMIPSGYTARGDGLKINQENRQLLIVSDINPTDMQQETLAREAIKQFLLSAKTMNLNEKGKWLEQLLVTIGKGSGELNQLKLINNPMESDQLSEILDLIMTQKPTDDYVTPNFYLNADLTRLFFQVGIISYIQPNELAVRTEWDSKTRQLKVFELQSVTPTINENEWMILK